MNTILYKGEEGVTDIAFVSCTDPDSSVRRVPFLGHQRISQSLMDLPREGIGPKGFNSFSRGVRIRISKETFSHLRISRGIQTPCHPLWIRPCVCLNQLISEPNKSIYTKLKKKYSNDCLS